MGERGSPRRTAAKRDASYPRRLGRYEILGGLATGGMAEILLGRVTGIAGFSRPVVVKRIHPVYADDTDFVAMLLDEARIAAGLHHSNVVQMLELGEQDGEVFLVMEYLEGESVYQLFKRLRRDKEPMSPRLAAHVVAEACNGLAAVHDLGVVHRDVSPDNLFVTYDGAVKILDFGVAKAKHRLTRTATGHIKGKYAYMAPEQFAGQVDARTDLFALGIVLHELCTGVPLFRHLDPMVIAYAIRSEPIPPLAKIAPEVAPQLSAICERALERDLDRRWASAAAMGDALRSFIEYTAGDPRTELRHVMARVFRLEIGAKRERLAELAARWTEQERDPAEDSNAATDPLARAASSAEPAPTLATPTAEAPATWSPTGLSTIAVEPGAYPRRGRRGALLFVGVAMVTLVASLVIWSGGDRDAPLDPARPDPPTATAVAAASIDAPTARTAARPDAARRVDARPVDARPVAARPDARPTIIAARPTVVAPAPSPTPRVAPPPRPIERVTVDISSRPPGATVWLGGQPVGTTPTKLTVKRAQKRLTLTLRKDGYGDTPVSISPDRARAVTVELKFRKF